MAARRLRHTQRGAALLIFLILLFMGGLTYVVNSLSPETVEARRQDQTRQALALAREALVGYALKYRDEETAQGRPDRMYGYLPLPDLGSSRNQNTDPNCKDATNNPLEGCDANTPTGIAFDANGIMPTIVGRLPWRTLGIPALKDGYGECLWLMVSSLHARKHRSTPPPVLPPMNWDTLGQFDIVVANGTAALLNTLASADKAHDRPVAIIFSPGPPLPGQNRNPVVGDDIRQCGGNYNAANYLDPVTASTLGGLTNYLAGTNAASGATGDSDTTNDPDLPRGLLTQGKVYASGGYFLAGACQNSDCAVLANDSGLPLTGDALFGSIRKNSQFRQDINSLLDRIASCLGSEITGMPTTYGKIAGADDHACYGKDVPPRGYYPNYRDMIFLAKPAGGANVTIDGLAQAGCAGALVFAGQRDPSQQRITSTQKANYANYLEDDNLASFTGSGNTFSGAGQLGSVMASKTNPQDVQRCAPTGSWNIAPECQTAHQDIVRCISSGASLNLVQSPALDALGGQLTGYDTASRVLTLGRLYSITAAQRNANAGAFFGCAWSVESRTLGGGLRSYFKFRILDTGEGFSFAIIDADRNQPGVCGSARQHMGYSGNNMTTASIAPPKIGIEIDTQRQANFNPSAANLLNNGRNDPNYTGGHFGIVYWGGALPIATSRPCASCNAPAYCSAGICYLPPEEDDNVHGLPTPPDPSSRPAPRNPPAPGSPTLGAGVYKLDPGLSQISVNQDIHVRVELTRMATDTIAHSNTYRLDVWLLKESGTDKSHIDAMKDTTRPMALSAPGFTAHASDSPILYDIQGNACGSGSTCPSGQRCSASDNMCYAEALQNVRLGFTTSQSTTANDQIIDISDWFTTWVP